VSSAGADPPKAGEASRTGRLIVTFLKALIESAADAKPEKGS
jgi:hypothetical protein